MVFDEIQTIASKIRTNIETVIVGKTDTINLILTTLFAGGNLLLEDVPGTGKTMLAKSLSKSLDCSFSRIQFTPDLLPSDVTGLNFYNQKESEFTFRQGPVFCNILLADEINRATPRTQSALLECMEEKQITVDGETRILDRPFFVMATQNPVETAGTFPLPEAQMDRFMMQLAMGFPTFQEEIQILNRFVHKSPLTELKPVCSKEQLIQIQDLISQVYIHPSVMEYLVHLVEATRKHSQVALGVSPRGSLALLKACQSFAAIQGMSYITPDIVKQIAPYVLPHRLVLRTSYNKMGSSKEIMTELLSQIPVPTEDFTH